MKFKHRIFHKITYIIRSSKLISYYPIRNDERSSTTFKLVFFCGEKGVNYLNASLISIYKFWKELPEVIIVSDDTPLNKIKNSLIKWPKKVNIVSWKECALYFKSIGNNDLYEYACKDLWGKKFVAINYFAQKFPILYSDTDILWFSSPIIELIQNEPFLKMCQDISYCYSSEMLNQLRQQKVMEGIPFNAGLIYANGNYSSFDDWKQLCSYLNIKADNRTEQTSFAILNNFFNPNDYFNLDEVFISVEDEFSLKYTKKMHPKIFARHYVSVKTTSFWKDFMLIILQDKFFNF